MDTSTQPRTINYIAGFVIVGLAWGLTTPFIRRAARSHKPLAHPLMDTPAVKSNWLKLRLYGTFFAVLDLLGNPNYAIPLVLNLTGSVWFFLLVGKAGKLPLSPTSTYLQQLDGDLATANHCRRYADARPKSSRLLFQSSILWPFYSQFWESGGWRTRLSAGVRILHVQPI